MVPVLVRAPSVARAVVEPEPKVEMIVLKPGHRVLDVMVRVASPVLLAMEPDKVHETIIAL